MLFTLVKTPSTTLNNLSKRQDLKAILIVLALIILVLQVRLLSSDGGIGELFSLQNKLAELQVEVDSLQQDNALLKKEVQDLQSNTKAIETIARQKLGMIKENEVFIKVIELPIDSKASEVSAPALTQTESGSIKIPETPTIQD